jgi:hypothetical protein
LKTRAAKLQAKRSRGRPRKEGERYPSGDRKRSETEKEACSVAIEARGRVHSLKTEDPRAGYVLGRLHMDGKITDDQLAAGNAYAETMAHYYRCVGITPPSPRAQSLFSVKGHDGEVSQSVADRARRASNEMMRVEGILLQCIDGPQVKRTIYNVAIMDYDHLRSMPDQQMLWLRRGLTALHNDKLLRTTGKSVMTVG